SGPAWSDPVATASVASRGIMSRSTSHGSAAGRAARAAASMIKASLSRLSRSASASPRTSKACRAATADMPAVFGWDRSARSLCGFVEAAVEPGAVVVTDAWGGYATLPDRGYRHLPVAAQGDPSVAEDFLPISHLIFSNLKSWLRGCHHGVSPQH